MTGPSRTDDDLAWWMALHAAPNVGDATFHRLLQKFATPRRALTEASPDSLQGIAGADACLVDSLLFAAIRIDHTRKLLGTLRSRGVKVLTFEDSDYPARLHRLKWPPGLIYMAGEYDEQIDTCSAAVIGSTHPSARAFRSAYRSAGALAAQGCTVVSGNAAGVDTAAHTGALDAGGRTVFVLPTGILRFRPPQEVPTARIERSAVVISDRPPEAPWETRGAILRNRITAALSSFLLVVETEPDGGTMNTYQAARKLGIPAAVAVFGPDTPEGNRLALSEGAVAVKSVAELLAFLANNRSTQTGTQQLFDWP